MARPLRLLSLDGGGVRGLSSLIILQRLMWGLTQDGNARVSDHFDMIGGTSTGGIIAIMLGCLPSVSITILLSQEIFSETLDRNNILLKGIQKVKNSFQKVAGVAQFSSEKLKEQVLKVLENSLPLAQKGGKAIEDVLLLNNDQKYKVFVVTAVGSTGAPYLIRSYTSGDQVPDNFTILQAALATSAAPLYFSPLRRPTGDSTSRGFVDGGLGNNNPIDYLNIEQGRFFSGREVGCIVSIGTGSASTTGVPKHLLGLGNKCAEISTECDSTHSKFMQAKKNYRYFRFTVANGLQGVDLSEWEKIDYIIDVTNNYLGLETQVDGCVQALKGVTDGLGPTEEGCLQMLLFPDIDLRQNEATMKISEGTFNWIWESNGDFKKWVDEGRGIFQINGKPGAGKSTMMANIIKTAADHTSNTQLRVVSFFFNNRGTQLPKSQEGLLRTLLVNILQENPSLFRHIYPTYNRQRGRQKKEEFTWHCAVLCKLLLAVLSDASIHPILLVIDALDECLEEDLDDVVLRLVEISKIPGVKICVSSRTNHQYFDRVEGQLVLDEKNSNDISDYVKQEMGGIQERGGIVASEVAGLADEIIKSAGGIFLWVVLVVRDVKQGVREGDTIQELKEKLIKIPKDIKGLLRKIFHEIKDASGNSWISECRSLFQLVLFAERPLSISELSDAIRVGSSQAQSEESSTSANMDSSRSSQFEKRLISRSGGLLEKGATNVVQLIHQSVKDFLIDEGLKILGVEQSLGEFSGEAHSYLAKCCIRYLTTKDLSESLALWESDFPDEGEVSSMGTDHTPHWETEHPFLSYALEYWIKHVSKAEEYGVDQTINMASFDEHHFSQWVRIANLITPPIRVAISHSRFKLDRRWMSGTALFHVAAENNMIWYFKDLTNLGETVNDIGGRWGTALYGAILEQHEEMCTLILTKGANTQIADRFGETPLYLAIKTANYTIAQQLVKFGANIKTTNEEGDTPLHLTSVTGNQSIVQLLLEEGADKGTKNNEGNTPLHLASQCGRNLVVQQLLNDPKDLDEQNEEGNTSLHLASTCGYLAGAIVELLLANKAATNIQNNEGNTPLHLLCSENYSNPPNSIESGENSPPDLAHDTSIVKMLLEKTLKPDLELKNTLGKTPLDLARDSQKSEIVDMILAKAADVVAL